MAYVINCDCGYTVRGETEDEIVQGAEQHIQEAHPDMVGKMDREQILALAEEASG